MSATVVRSWHSLHLTTWRAGPCAAYGAQTRRAARAYSVRELVLPFALRRDPNHRIAIHGSQPLLAAEELWRGGVAGRIALHCRWPVAAPRSYTPADWLTSAPGWTPEAWAGTGRTQAREAQTPAAARTSVPLAAARSAQRIRRLHAGRRTLRMRARLRSVALQRCSSSDASGAPVRRCRRGVRRRADAQTRRMRGVQGAHLGPTAAVAVAALPSVPSEVSPPEPRSPW